jgi:hypothetical protein
MAQSSNPGYFEGSEIPSQSINQAWWSTPVHSSYGISRRLKVQAYLGIM